MTPTFYRITAENPYLSTEEEYPGLTLEEAAHRMDDLTGVGADVILADFEESCERCVGKGWLTAPSMKCPTCHGAGKRSDPWEWVDPETGREVTMRLEVG